MDECLLAFEILKQRLTAALVSYFIDLLFLYQLKVEVSDFAYGGFFV